MDGGAGGYTSTDNSLRPSRHDQGRFSTATRLRNDLLMDQWL